MFVPTLQSLRPRLSCGDRGCHENAAPADNMPLEIADPRRAGLGVPSRRAVSSVGQSASFTPRRSLVRVQYRPPRANQSGRVPSGRWTNPTPAMVLIVGCKAGRPAAGGARGLPAPSLCRDAPPSRVVNGMTQPHRPTLVTNPTDDPAFAAAAQAALEDGQTTDQLQAVLRRVYPGAVVRARDLAGDPLVWYVYREGHWIRSQGRS